MDPHEVVGGGEAALLVEAELRVGLEGALDVGQGLQGIVDVDVPVQAVLQLPPAVPRNECPHPLDRQVHILNRLQEGLECGRVIGRYAKDFLKLVLECFRSALDDHLVPVLLVDFGVKDLEAIGDVGDVGVLQESLVEVLGVLDDREEGIGKVGEGVVGEGGGPVPVLQVYGREYSLLDAGVLVLLFNYAQGLVGCEGDQQQVQHELPGEPVEPHVLLERAQGHPLHEVHLDYALLSLHLIYYSPHILLIRVDKIKENALPPAAVVRGRLVQ